MTNVNLHLSKDIFVPKFYPYLLDYSKRWMVLMGSAGSGKSWFIAQRLIIRCVKEPDFRVLVCRRYGTTLRNTCFSLFKEVLKQGKILQYVKIRETDMAIKFGNGSEIIMTGLDEETKLLSLANISTIWVEEAYECSEDIVNQLNLRMRGKAENQQLILSFNPINKSSWLYKFCNNLPESSIYIHSTFKDNPFLNEDYIKSLEDLETRNPAKGRVYGLGEWGVNPEGLVIKNWVTEDFDEMALAEKGLEHRCGMDLGGVDPSAIIDTLYDKENKIIYVFNEFYKSGCQLTDLVDAIGAMNLGKSKIYVDSAEPRSIEYFKSQGIRAIGCAKGKDSIKNGLMFLQDNKIIVKPKCVKFINELENFSYIKSKTTGEWTEDTTHEYSHAIDACRYGYSDIYTNKKIQTLSKAAFGL